MTKRLTRRSLLASSGIAALTAIAGCSQISTNQISSFDFAVEDGDRQAEEPVVTTARNQIIIEGVISVRNGCYRPRLKTIEFDEKESTVTATIEEFENSNEDTVSCTQAIQDHPYTLNVTFSEGLPDSVKLTEEGVETKTYDLEVSD